MYINPFLAGVLATIGVELILILSTAFVASIKKKNNGGRK